MCAMCAVQVFDLWDSLRERLPVTPLDFRFYTNQPKNRFQGTNSARLCSLASRYNNPIPTRFLAPIDCLKIPAQLDKTHIHTHTLLEVEAWEELCTLYTFIVQPRTYALGIEIGWNHLRTRRLQFMPMSRPDL